MAKRGRPSKASKLLQHPNAGAASAVAGIPSCPKGLGVLAKKKWRQITKLMHAAGTITLLDGDMLAQYCEAYERRETALQQLGTEYTIDGPKGRYMNPVLHVANKALDQMVRLSKLLGIDKLTARSLGVSTKQAGHQGVDVRDRSQGLPPPEEQTA